MAMKKLIISTFLLFSVAANGADIFIENYESIDGAEHQRIIIRGGITNGDTQRFINLLKNSNQYLVTVWLDSNGGNVEESLGIAEVVRELRLRTRVIKGGVCASACFFVWLEGSTRNASGPNGGAFGQLGLHRPYLTSITNDPDSINKQNRIAAYVRNHLENRHVPRRLIDLMMSRASNQIYWVSLDDFDQYLRPVNPDIEELNIARCGDSSNRLMLLRYRNTGRLTNSDIQELDKNIDSIFDCEGELTIAALEEGYERLEKGWRPKNLKLTAEKNAADNAQEVEDIHPGWIKIVQSIEFTVWLDEQDAATRMLSKSYLPSDAIRLISLYKSENQR
jgi:hypothetical protein